MKGRHFTARDAHLPRRHWQTLRNNELEKAPQREPRLSFLKARERVTVSSGFCWGWMYGRWWAAFINCIYKSWKLRAFGTPPARQWKQHRLDSMGSKGSCAPWLLWVSHLRCGDTSPLTRTFLFSLHFQRLQLPSLRSEGTRRRCSQSVPPAQPFLTVPAARSTSASTSTYSRPSKMPHLLPSDLAWQACCIYFYDSLTIKATWRHSTCRQHPKPNPWGSSSFLVVLVGGMQAFLQYIGHRWKTLPVVGLGLWVPSQLTSSSSSLLKQTTSTSNVLISGFQLSLPGLCTGPIEGSFPDVPWKERCCLIYPGANQLMTS